MGGRGTSDTVLGQFFVISLTILPDILKCGLSIMLMSHERGLVGTRMFLTSRMLVAHLRGYRKIFPNIMNFHIASITILMTEITEDAVLEDADVCNGRFTHADAKRNDHCVLRGACLLQYLEKIGFLILRIL